MAEPARSGPPGGGGSRGAPLAAPAGRRLIAAASVAIVGAFGAPVWAAEPPPPGPRDVLVVGLGAAPGLAEVVARGASRPDLRVRAFVPPPAPAPPEAPPTKAIKGALRRAASALGSFELDDAKRRLGEAQALLAPHVGLAGVLELEREALVLDVTLAHAARDDPRLDAALGAYARRFPAAGPPPRTPWPPALVARLAQKTPVRDASISVKTTPPGAALTLDGEDVGVSPATITQLAAGTHRLRAERPGHLSADTSVELGPGASALVEVVLPLDVAAALRAATARAGLSPELAAAIRAEAPGAALLLIEGAAGGAELARQDGSTPSARARVASLGAADLAGALDTLLGPRPEAPVAASGPPTWAWIALGAGVATAGVGIGTRVSAVSVEHELISRDGALTQAEAYAIRSEAESRATAGTVVIVLGTAIASAFAAWILYQSEP